MLKKTSADGLVLEHSSWPPNAYLADFDIDGRRLKKEHRDWLQKRIVKADADRASQCGQWHIELTGRASRSGGDAYNHRLSADRIEMVEAFLRSRMRGDRLSISPKPLGEGAPLESTIYENEMDRSVHVIAVFVRCGKPKPKPKPRVVPKPIPWRPKPDKVLHFTVRALAVEVEVSPFGVPKIPMKKGNMNVRAFLEVREALTGEVAWYEFEGRGPYSGTDRDGFGWSDWQEGFKLGKSHGFGTSRPMDAEDFGGTAAMTLDDPHLGTADTFEFGPRASFTARRQMVRIKDMSFGKPKRPILDACHGGGPAFGQMTLVKKRPSWAK